MPRIVRTMFVDEKDGLPLVGSGDNALGVRPGIDVRLEDDEKTVKLDYNGMSVAKSWTVLPGTLIPKHLDDGHNGADGEGIAVFVHGTGDFVEAPVAAGLVLWRKKRRRNRGTVGPTAAVDLQHLQTDLANTRSNWKHDESV